MENVLVRTPWKETWLELEKAGVETTRGWKASRERMESGSGVRCGIAKGGSCGVRTQGTTIIREREEPMVRWRRGMAHPCQAPHGHGIATSGVHMGIIVKFSEALPCVKSPVSRTSGAIYAVT